MASPYFAFDRSRYCSSVTCSIQSTTLPSSFSWMAMCVMAVVGEAPCQCFSPGGNQITSPGRISWTGSPQRWTSPLPAVTINVCPSGCVCHAVRAPGSNVTPAPPTRAGSGASNSGAIRTVPVNQAAAVLAGDDLEIGWTGNTAFGPYVVNGAGTARGVFTIPASGYSGSFSTQP